MKTDYLFLLNGAEIPENLFLELSSYCNLNYIPYRRNDIAELMPVGDEFFVKCNLQIDMLPFAKFFIDLFKRKELYLQKCLENEKV